MTTGPDDPSPRSFGLADVFGGLLLAQVSSLVLGLAILSLAGVDATTDLDALSLRLIAILQVPLWLGYLGSPLYLARERGLRSTFGLRMERADVWWGLGIGLVTQLVLVPLLYVPIQAIFGRLDISESARELTDRATDPFGVVLLLLIVAVGAPMVEELFFRGLAQQAFIGRFGSGIGVVLQAVLFGAIHFQLVQLPGLILFGLVAGELTRRSGRLGPAVWAHVGFNTVSVLVLIFW